MNWTDEADKLLIDLWKKGGTLTEVADEMTAAGFPVERNAIAGRKHRLAKKGVFFEARPEQTPQALNGRRKDPIIVPRKAIRESKPVAHDEGVDYMKNGPDGCKAILDKRGGDGLRMCCGKLRLNGLPYCSTHTRLYCSPTSNRS